VVKLLVAHRSLSYEAPRQFVPAPAPIQPLVTNPSRVAPPSLSYEVSPRQSVLAHPPTQPWATHPSRAALPSSAPIPITRFIPHPTGSGSAASHAPTPRAPGPTSTAHHSASGGERHPPASRHSSGEAPRATSRDSRPVSRVSAPRENRSPSYTRSRSSSRAPSQSSSQGPSPPTYSQPTGLQYQGPDERASRSSTRAPSRSFSREPPRSSSDHYQGSHERASRSSSRSRNSQARSSRPGSPASYRAPTCKEEGPWPCNQPPVDGFDGYCPLHDQLSLLPE